ncbi:MAG: hypothetical protein AABY55_00340 [Candidatus Omnitrophota bacterium]
MNYIKLRQIKKLYFGYEELARILGISAESGRVTAVRFVKQGVLVRPKKNIYILREKWDNLAREEKFMLANLMQSPSYVSLMTAMDYYEVTTQVQNNFIESVLIYRTKRIEIEGAVFNYSRINKDLYSCFIKKEGFFIAVPEKAFLDALYFMSLGRYTFDITSIDRARLDKSQIKKIAGAYPKKTQVLLRKYGYI